MKTLKISGQYQSSNATVKGSKKTILNFLRDEARKLRRDSRKRHNLDNSVMSIDENLHKSKLVTIASFELNNLGTENLCELLNNHGVKKYEVK